MMSSYWKEQAKLLETDFLQKLKAFLSINSIEDLSTAGEGKPFGEGVAKALEFMLELGRRDGFRTKNLEGYAGYIEWGEGEEEVGVLVHVDVVTVGDNWTTPPFFPDIRNGRIYARGAIDDKGPALAAYYALKIVKQSGVPLSKRIRLIIGTDEESGWLCMERYRQLETLPEIGFSPDAQFPMIHAEKGQINPTLAIDESKLFSDEDEGNWRLTSFAAGDQANSVPEKATAVVALPDNAVAEGLQAKFQVYTSSNQVAGHMEWHDSHELHFSLKGVPAHGMEPQKGLNAGTMLARFLHQFPFAGRDRAFLHFLSDILHEDYYGERLNIACEDEVTGKLTVNPGILRYDQREGAMVRLNIRYPATVSREQRIALLEQQIHRLGWKFTQLRSSKAHYVSKDHPSIQILSRIYQEHTGNPASLLSTGGATYAKTLKAGIAFGPVFPGKELTAHQTDEYAEIDDLFAAMAMYAHAMSELAK
jgi:succinyl-diaminopimelate desuccinylase